MDLKTLGRTDLKVTDICLGTMTWGSQNTEAEGHAQIARARDIGINFMDTAELYAVPGSVETSGWTEEIIGNWFQANGDRDSWILASKIGGGGSPHLRNGHRADGPSIREAVEASLKRLKTDYIDLYQIHWASRGSYNFDGSWTYQPHKQDTSDVLANLEDMLEALGDLVAQGKIRHIGVSNETSWGVMQYLAIAEAKGYPRLASIQNEYSLLRRQFDLDMAEVSHHEDVGLLAYSPLAAGLLTGKYFDGAMPKGSRKDYQKGFWRLNEHSERAAKEYHALAARHGLDPVQMSIAFCRSRPFMTSTIIGATSIEQLDHILAARELTLTAEVLAEIDAINRRYPRPI
ncbi:MAG: aldo/keto reductase [Devosia sp.]|uniref:aldo/keto reductase n=1 Tax=unclassified Devosia TaxID=196773 RepID=UPI0019EF5DD2|nr:MULTISPECIES: aldo/keto reductase [unclassified Devosia]MBF0679456.1 aldo/keto reductase [Devosia sp.]WEJ33787.1 aldo/keto reductase [Devosia sp. SD17-2]